MSIRIALIGNPNCGKTTLFNNLTGSEEFVGNWPGVTVEKKERKLKTNKNIIIVDLPGIYSLLSHTMDEKVSSNFLISEKPDVILNIVDGTNLERNLYLTTQLLDLNFPIVIAISMMDIVKKNKIQIDFEAISKKLNCKVVKISEFNGKANFKAINEAINEALCKNHYRKYLKFSDAIESSLVKISEIIKLNKNVTNKNLRWFTIKLFEKDKKTVKLLELSKMERQKIATIIEIAEKDFDDDSCSILINERYSYIDNIQSKNYGFLCENSQKRFEFSDKIDNLLTHRYFSIIILIAILTLIYFISITLVGKPLSDWINIHFLGDFLKPSITNVLLAINATNWLIDLIVNGIVAGVGSVISFMPQIALIFLFLAILEDCGYMARIAFIMDKIFSKFGFSGKSLISFLISSGCGATGIAATRTIENKEERTATIATTTFIPCNAKIPIISGICNLVFPGSLFIAPIIYFICFSVVMFSGIIFKKFSKKNKESTDNFIMELPPYCIPPLKKILNKTFVNTKAFIFKAGTVILLASILIWFLSNFKPSDTIFKIEFTENKEDSYLALAGKLIAPIFTPLGFSSWPASIATISGIFAKENIISSLGIISNETDPSQNIAQFNTIFSNSAGALSFLTFNLLCAPCCAAIGTIYRQTSSIKSTAKILLFQTTMAYFVALIINILGNIFLDFTNINLLNIASLIPCIICILLISKLK